MVDLDLAGNREVSSLDMLHYNNPNEPFFILKCPRVLFKTNEEGPWCPRCRIRDPEPVW